MNIFYFIHLFAILLCLGQVSAKTLPVVPPNNVTMSDDHQKYFELTMQLESQFKSSFKSAMKSMLPRLIAFQEDQILSRDCMQSLMKYVMNLSRAKMWAVQMLDATSKLPPGILYGTFADFGSFDECLDVEVRHKDGRLDFQGSSCTVEMRPPMPPLPRRVSLAEKRIASPEDTLGAQFREAYQALHHKHLKFVVCVPSLCSLQDVRRIASRITNATDFKIKVPECYKKEEINLEAVHLAVIVSLGVLLLLGIIASIYKHYNANRMDKTIGFLGKFLSSFSLTSNFKHLVSTTGGSSELKCIHGMRTIGMCWVILGHSYVFMDFELLKDPINIQTWFGTLTFELIHNGWLAVETFFLISGILVTYSGMKIVTKTKGKLNIPLLILRRYLRLTPSLLLLTGLVFFMPLMSSGPFWYEQAEPQIESCRKYWWASLLYFSNWWGIDKGCIQTTWYLAADFQLHILSLFIILVFFRNSKIAVGILFAAIAFSCAAVGAQTWFWDLGATVQLSAGDNKQVFEGLNRIHIQTFTHLGSHCIGMLVGYFIYKFRDVQLSKATVILGWCLSTALCLITVLGSHRFSAGHETSPYLSIFYAAMHRSVFSFGVAWVLLACITGYGGFINSLLSSAVMIPISRLTYMIYLVHPLVIWVKLGSLRERHFASHYEFVYTYISNAVLSVVLAFPFYLLLEAPLSSLERQFSQRASSGPQDAHAQKTGVTLVKMGLGTFDQHLQEKSKL